MADLILPVKRIYFEQMRDGTKPDEFRLANDYWRRRLVGRNYDRVIVTLGYPSRDDEARRLVRPWRGYEQRTITHELFGPHAVEVFAIHINEVFHG